MIKIIIADDHPLVLDGLAEYFKDEKHIKIVGMTTKSCEIISLIKQTKADILLLDYSFNNQNPDGIEVLKTIKKQNIPISVIIITGYTETRLIHKFLELGAKGYLFKSSTREEYIETIKNVFLGGKILGADVNKILLDERKDISFKINFTKTELKILKMIGEGLTTKEIARILNKSINTINSHRKNILSKLQMIDNGSNPPSYNINYYIAKLDLLNKYNLFE